jgi:predicted nucleic acid-binding protein
VLRTAVLDTSILTDALLKNATRGEAVRECLSRFDQILVPGYAVKEFIAGPLTYFSWLHNRVTSEESLQAVFDWLHRISRTPRRYATSTVIEALREAAAHAKEHHLDSLTERHGRRTSLDAVIKDQLRLSLRGTILTAWARLRGYSSSIVDSPSCFRGGELSHAGDLLLIAGSRCLGKECNLWPIASARASLVALQAAVEETRPSRERERRLAVMERVVATPGTPISEKECRALGDVMIVLSGPPDATIVTSNVRDFASLCRATEKEMMNPY